MTQKFELDSKKLSGLTTDGAQAMLGKPKEFRKHLDLKSVSLNHCIID